MRKSIVTSVTLSLAMLLSPFGSMTARDHRGQSGNNRGSSISSPGSSKPGNRPGSNNGNHNGNRPGGNHNGNRPGSNNGNHNGNRPGGNNGNHNGNRPGSNNGNHNGNRPGGNNGNHNGNRPGGNNGNHNGNRPGGNNGNHNGNRPGGNNGNHHWGSHWGGTSIPRPGVGATPSPRPGYKYHPPRLHRWERPLPPRPPRVNYVPVRVVPSIRNVLGLTFGTLIDYGINSLLSAGYNVTGTWDNTIYLSNVQQFGVVWPEATIYYGTNGMQSARFQYWSYAPNNYTFNSVYNALRAAYGNPVSTTSNYGLTVYTWWGGNNTGYITLQYGPGECDGGGYRYYTDLIYGY